MAKKEQTFQPKADQPTVQVRRSYYSFSKEYPHRQITLEKKRKKPWSFNRALRITLCVLCFALIAAVSFFATDLALRISEKDPSDEQSIQTPDIAADLSHLQGMYVSHDVLKDKRSVKACIRRLKRSDCNSVLIDFKTADGLLVYSSAELLAIQADCCLYDTQTINDALSLFKKAGIQVFAGVHCFNDARIAAFEPALAVKYLDTDVSWLDALEENGGLPWVNPYATKARAYLKGLIAEIAALGVNGIVLKNLSFPVGEATDTASFPGEDASVKRNKLLKNLIHSVRADLPETCALLLSVDANDIAGNNMRYDGSIFPNECNGILCNTANRPQDVMINSDDNYASAIGLYHTLIGETNNSAFVLEIPQNEADAAYLRALSRNGYASVFVDE